jgi:hypothetical protein
VTTTATAEGIAIPPQGHAIATVGGVELAAILPIVRVIPTVIFKEFAPPTPLPHFVVVTWATVAKHARHTATTHAVMAFVRACSVWVGVEV